MHFVVLSCTLDDIVAIDGRFAPAAVIRKSEVMERGH
jgi:hypothetical protein